MEDSGLETSPGRSGEKQRRWGLAVGLIAVLCVFRDVLLGETLFYSDFSTIYHPLELWSARAIERGQLPLWNPDLALGLPQLANPILGTLYPPNLLLLILPFTFGLNLLLVLHVALALVLGWRLVRALHGSPAAALLGGASFALSGTLISSTSYVFPVFAWAWVPLAMEGAVRVGHERLLGTALLALGTAMTLLAGDPLATGAAVGLGLALGLATASNLREAWRRVPALVLALALGLGLSAAQLLPTLAFLGDSVRATGAAAASAGSWSFAPVRVLGFAVPSFWGRFAPDLSYFGQYLAEDLNDGNFFYYSHYLGTLPLVLLPLALSLRRLRPLATTLLLVAVATVLLSFGRHLPGYEWLTAHVPLMGYFRYPEKWLMVTTLSLATVGALGLHALTSGATGRVARGASLAIAGAIAALALYAILADAPLRAMIRAHARVPIEDAARTAQITSGLLALVMAAAGVGLLFARRARWAPWALAALAVVDVSVANGGLVWTTPDKVFDGADRTMDVLRRHAGGDTGPVARHDSLDRVRMHKDLEGLAGRYRLQGATLRANAALEAGGALLGAETPARLGHAIQPEEWLFADPGRAAPLLGVRYVLVSATRPPPSVVAAAPNTLHRVTTVAPLDLAILSPVTPPLPPAFCVAATRLVTRDEVLPALLTGDPAHVAVVEPAARLGPTGAAGALAALSTTPGRGATACGRVERTDTRIEVHVDTEQPALLVVRDAFASGWEATIDGQAAPIFRAYGSLKATPVDSGPHVVVFRYRAPLLVAGVAFSGASALILLGIVVLMGRRRWRGPDERAVRSGVRPQ